MRACPPQQLLDLSILPESYNRLALLAHFPSVESSHTLSLPISAPQPTDRATACLAAFTEITSLTFRPWNQPEALSRAFEAIQSLPYLLSLDLSRTHLTTAACTALQDSMQFMPQLEALNVSNCGLYEPTLRILLQGVCMLPLEELVLSDNELFLEGALILSDHFPQLQQLTKLELVNTKLLRPVVQTESIESVASRVWSGDPGYTKSFCSQLPKLKALQHLDLAGNYIVVGYHYLMEIVAESSMPSLAWFRYDIVGRVMFAGWVPRSITSRQPTTAISGLQHQFHHAPACSSQLEITIHSFSDVPAPDVAALFDITHNNHPLAAFPSTPFVAHSPLHITYLKLGICNVETQRDDLAAELAVLTHLQRLDVDCEQFIEGEITKNYVTDDEVLPFASILSRFTSLTSLTWKHRTRNASNQCGCASPLPEPLCP